MLALTNPNAAKREMLKPSQSIKQNEQALANNKGAPFPLSRLKASNIAGKDTGKRTIKDMSNGSKI